jgi:hypothetical protein
LTLGFDPRRIGEKEHGREELAALAGLRLQDARPYFAAADERGFRDAYNRFVGAFPREAAAISRLRPDGVGPGELVAWFVFDDVCLGGRNSPVDLLVDGREFAEVKAGVYSRRAGALYDFKATRDGDPAVGLLLGDLARLNEAHRGAAGEDLPGWRSGGVPAVTLRSWGETGPALPEIVDRWREQAFTDYLEGKPMALLDARTMRMPFFGCLTREMLGLHRVARHQPLARVRLPTGVNNKCE